MDLTPRGKTYLVILLLSFLFSYLIITLGFFPHLGFSLSFLIFALFTYANKKNKNSETKKYLIFSVLFSVLLFIRSEPFITFLNFLGTIFFGFLMLTSGSKSSFGILDLIYRPFDFAFKSILTKSDYFLEKFQGKESKKDINAVNTVFGTVITLVILAIVLPLLSSANPLFRNLVETLLKYFNLQELFKNLGYDNIFLWSLRFVFFLGFLFIIPKILTIINKDKDYLNSFPLMAEAFPLTIPKYALSFVLLVFFITQLQFYFATEETLKNIGLTYSQHAREVFGQLSVVAGIVLLLVYNDTKRDRKSNILNWTLGIQGIFLTIMAYKSAFEYINAWGLTYIRLYGLTFATWITGIFVLFFDSYHRGLSKSIFIKNAILLTGIVLLVVNILNFDYMIYNFKKAETGQGVDYTYLSTLSPDALSYRDQYNRLKQATDTPEITTDYNNNNPFILLYKIERLQNKYSELDLRTLNLLEYLEYRNIKSINTEELRAVLAPTPPIY